MGMTLETKIDELVLALMIQNKFDDGQTTRAWKTFQDESIERLQQKNYIQTIPHAKSVSFTQQGLDRAKELFKKYISDDNG